MTWLKYDALFDLADKGAKIGKNVKIDSTAIIVNPGLLKIDDNSRIGAFSFLSGKVSIGKFTEIGVHVTISGFDGVSIGDCCAISPYGYLFTNSADFQNQSLSLPTVPEKFKTKRDSGPIQIANHTIIGGGSKVFPNCEIRIGCKFGVNSVIKGLYYPWGLYVSDGNKIARRLKDLDPSAIMINYQKLLESTKGS